MFSKIAVIATFAVAAPATSTTVTFRPEAESCYIRDSLSGEESFNGVENTESSRFSTSLDTTLLDVLSSAASFSIDIALSPNILIGVLNPSHDLLPCSHVWAKAIDSSSNIPFFNQLHCVPSSNSFELVLTQFSWVDLHSTLGSSEGNVSNCQLESHQGSEGLYLLEVNVFGISGTSLGWQQMSRMLSSEQKIRKPKSTYL